MIVNQEFSELQFVAVYLEDKILKKVHCYKPEFRILGIAFTNILRIWTCSVDCYQMESFDYT